MYLNCFKLTCLRRDRQIKETGGVAMQAGSNCALPNLALFDLSVST